MKLYRYTKYINNDLFSFTSVHLEKVHTLQTQDSHNPQLPQLKATVLRSVFTVGLLCNSFDLDVICQAEEVHERWFFFQWLHCWV